MKARTHRLLQEYVKTFLGLTKKEDVHELRKSAGLSENRCKSIILSFCNLIRECFRVKIWKLRCTEVISMENILGIASKEKRNKKPENSVQKNRSSKKERKSPEQSNKRQEEQEAQMNTHKNEIGDKVEAWIKYGKKWLGI